jgi:hypothetical protein
MSQATVYLIRHGEKPEPEADGLSAKGITRAEALPGVFGPQSAYNIGYILAEHPKKGAVHRVYPAILILFSFPKTFVKVLQIHTDVSDRK